MKFLLAFVPLAFSSPASAQLTRVDSMLAAAIVPMLPAVNGVPAILAGDSSIALLASAMPRPASLASASAPTFYVTTLSAIAHRTDSGARTEIRIEGKVLAPMSSIATPRSLARTAILPFSESDWDIVEHDRSLFVHGDQPAGSFWSSVVEPVIVVLGAAAVVALFFLIRS